jgi:hypothetical protein
MNRAAITTLREFQRGFSVASHNPVDKSYRVYGGAGCGGRPER